MCRTRNSEIEFYFRKLLSTLALTCECVCFLDTQAKDVRLKTMFRPSLGHRLTCNSESFIFVIPVMKEKEKQSSISMCAIYFNKDLFPSKQIITLTGRTIFKTAAKYFITQRRVSFLSDNA